MKNVPVLRQETTLHHLAPEKFLCIWTRNTSSDLRSMRILTYHQFLSSKVRNPRRRRIKTPIKITFSHYLPGIAEAVSKKTVPS